MMGIGPMELAIVAVLALLVFGPKRVPELGRSLGSGMRSFKHAVSTNDDDSEQGELAKSSDASTADTTP